MKLLIDGAAGIYVPRNFHENFDFGTWNVDIKEFSDLSDPDKEYYWDAWDELLGKAEFYDGEHKWTLYQDGDLFAVRDDHNWDE